LPGQCFRGVALRYFNVFGPQRAGIGVRRRLISCKPRWNSARQIMATKTGRAFHCIATS
jgi:hypothetical protein